MRLLILPAKAQTLALEPRQKDVAVANSNAKKDGAAANPNAEKDGASANSNWRGWRHILSFLFIIWSMHFLLSHLP